MPKTCAPLHIFSTFWRDEVLVNAKKNQLGPTNIL